MAQPSHRSGFTLVELSIVLVIIGLIVGGILLGKDLINAAYIRAQTKQIGDLETAVNAFRLKYNCLPGDCGSATSYFGATDADGNSIVDGDNDGVIKATVGGGGPWGAGECLNPDLGGEVTQLFYQLNAARLGIIDRTTGVQMVAMNNRTGIYITCLGNPGNQMTPLFLRSGNVIVAGSATSAGTGGTSGRIGYAVGSFGVANYGIYGRNSVNSLTLKPIGIPMEAIRQIDTKIDDAVETSGRFGIVSAESGCTYASITACNGTAGKRISQ